MLTTDQAQILDKIRPSCASDTLLWLRDYKGQDMDAIFSAWADRLGLRYVGCGSGRATFLFDRQHVLKIGYTRCGMQGNRRERLATMLLPPEIHAQVYDCAEDGLWLLQERVSRLPAGSKRRDPFQPWGKFRAVMQTAEETVPGAVVDMEIENFGRRKDGQIVLVDIENFGPLSQVLRPGETEELRWAPVRRRAG